MSSTSDTRNRYRLTKLCPMVVRSSSWLRNSVRATKYTNPKLISSAPFWTVMRSLGSSVDRLAQASANEPTE